MPSCAPVAQGANRCLPRPVAFCETSRFPPFSPFFHCLSSSIHQCASLLSLLIQCWKMSSQILLERILADGLKHKWWGKERTRRLRAHICTATWLSVCVHWGLRVCVCVSGFILSHIYTTSHASISASQARIEDMPCYFYYLPIQAARRRLMQRGAQRLLLFKNNTLWHLHINKCVIHDYLIQPLCSRCQLLKKSND